MIPRITANVIEFDKWIGTPTFSHFTPQCTPKEWNLSRVDCEKNNYGFLWDV
jgi:hypothetical protein